MATQKLADSYMKGVCVANLSIVYFTKSILIDLRSL